MLIEFLKSPTGTYNLAYNIGGRMDCKDADLVKRMVKDGTCKVLEDPKKTKRVSKKTSK